MKALKVVLIIVLVLALIVAGVVWYVLNRIGNNVIGAGTEPETTPSPTPDAMEPVIITITDQGDVIGTPTPEPELTPEVTAIPSMEGVYNILLVGTDSRTSPDDPEGRSDTMMMASYNAGTHELKLLSFMRDLRVKRQGSSGRYTFQNKINGAFSKGHYHKEDTPVQELLETINFNFGLDIEYYAVVGFDGFAALVDKIGGIEVNLSREEAYFINWRYADVTTSDESGKGQRKELLAKQGKPVLEEVDGPVTLNGEQALWYARNRSSAYNGELGSDYTRVNRQQDLLKLIYKKVTSELNLTTGLALVSFACDYVSTNMKLDTMLQLATEFFRNDVTIETSRVPFPDQKHSYYVNEETGEQTDQIVINFKTTQALIQEYLNGSETTAEETPEP